MSNAYKKLVKDCEGILTEGGFVARMSRVEVYHTLGGRIVEDNAYLKHKKGNRELIKKLASDIKTSRRLLYYAIKFYSKFPDLALLPEAKDISWTGILNKYLTTKKEKEKLPDTQCPHCGKWFIRNL